MKEVFSFGPFQLDAQARVLTHNGEPVVLAGRQFDLLHLLVSRAGQVLSKDLLIEAAWRDVAVTDNSLEQAISGLRRILISQGRQHYIETLARRGYRFAASVTRLQKRATDEALDALLAPHRAWLEGRAALESLDRAQILQARGVFEGVLEHVPDQSSAHVGLANACVMQFEMTRTATAPDVAALAIALHHAQEACRLDSNYGEAWATLGFVLERTGKHADALAASRRAVTLEPDNWRHHLRLSSIAWGEERLREARRTLALLPGFSLAHWLAATVYVARGTLKEAEHELTTGIGKPEGRPADRQRFSGVALHWLLGLLYAARGEDELALEEFGLELSAESRGHLYARECAANTWYSIAVVRKGRKEDGEARIAFARALELVPLHPMARIGLQALNGSTIDGPDPRLPPAETAMARAAALVIDSAPQEAAALIDRFLEAAPQGNACWTLPVEPLLAVRTAPTAWNPVLARLRTRAA